MNTAKPIEEELNDIFYRFKDNVTTTLRTKAIRNLEARFVDVEEVVKEDHGAIESIKRGIGTIWGGFNKDKKK
jgi:hypothetical protein